MKKLIYILVLIPHYIFSNNTSQELNIVEISQVGATVVAAIAILIAAYQMYITRKNFQKQENFFKEESEFFKTEIKNMRNEYRINAVQNSFHMINEYTYGNIDKHVKNLHDNVRTLYNDEKNIWSNDIDLYKDILSINVIAYAKSSKITKIEIARIQSEIEFSTTRILNFFENLCEATQHGIADGKYNINFFREIFLDYYIFTQVYIEKSRETCNDSTLWELFYEKGKEISSNMTKAEIEAKKSFYTKPEQITL